MKIREGAQLTESSAKADGFYLSIILLSPLHSPVEYLCLFTLVASRWYKEGD